MKEGESVGEKEQTTMQEISNQSANQDNISVPSDDNQYINEPIQYDQKNYGNTYPIGVGADGQEKYLLGPHCYLFFITWVISLGGCSYMLIQIYPFANPFFFWLSAISIAIYGWIYGKLGFSRPGVASSAFLPQNLGEHIIQRYCVPCKIIRERTTKHCYYCDVCIYGYDHHCPWVGKCIGRDNLRLFYTFLCSVSTALTLMIITTSTAGKPVVL